MSDRPRSIALDLLRTVAILAMIVYHAAYDLQRFYGWSVDIHHGGWKILQVLTASLFLLLVGVGASISHRRPLKRFLRIGAAALLISAVTYAIDPQTYVRFGILHLIATAAILIPIMKWSYGRANRMSLSMIITTIIIGACLIAAGPWFASMRTGSPFLIPLGIRPPGFSTVDYYPLVPWFGVILIGYGIGNLLYTRFANRKKFRLEAKLRSVEALSWPGRHSLFLYLIHQPIIIGLLWLIIGAPSF